MTKPIPNPGAKASDPLASAGGRSRSTRAFLAALALLGVSSLSFDAAAVDSDDAFKNADQQVRSVQQGVGSIQAAIQKSRSEERGPAQRIADAVLLLGSKDYARAANVLNEVVEKYPDHPTAFPDGLSLLGETYFRSRQYLSAQRVFKQIVDKGNEPRFAPYQAKALGRLVDVALRTKDYSSLDDIFAAMNLSLIHI